MENNINIPNLITFARIALAPVFFSLMFSGKYGIIGALVIITIAAITDFYDGKIARKYKTVTKLGEFLDPLADKIILSCAFISFYILKLIPLIPVVIIIFREFLITFLRIQSIASEKRIQTLLIGKIKTTLQFTSIYLLIIHVIIKSFYINQQLNILTLNIATTIFYMATMLATSSGIMYLAKNNKLAEFISTFSYIGYFPVSPGTFASLLATISMFFVKTTPIYPKIIFLVILFVIGVLITDKFSKQIKTHDPGLIVIDEICAMALILFFTPQTIGFYSLAFALFRFFDITKIPFIWKIEEKFKSGFGIMFDDIAAASFSIIIIQIIKTLNF